MAHVFVGSNVGLNFCLWLYEFAVFGFNNEIHFPLDNFLLNTLSVVFTCLFFPVLLFLESQFSLAFFPPLYPFPFLLYGLINNPPCSSCMQ